MELGERGVLKKGQKYNRHGEVAWTHGEERYFSLRFGYRVCLHFDDLHLIIFLACLNFCSKVSKRTIMCSP